jgi:hypothetical protein
VWVKASESPSAWANHWGESSSGPHKVKASSDVGPLLSSIQGDRAVVTLGGRKLTVEFDKGRILLDDTPQATLPAETKVVEIRYVGGKLSVTADGTDVPRVDAAAAPPKSEGPPVVWVSQSENAQQGGASITVNGFGSHSVKVVSDVSQSSNGEGDRAEVTLGGRKLVVEFDKCRLLVDGSEQATIPAGAKGVEIRFLGGKLSVTADGADLPRPGVSK